ALPLPVEMLLMPQGLAEGNVMPGPLLARELTVADLLAQRFDLPDQDVDPRVLAAGLEQAVELVLDLADDPAEAGQARSGGEEHLADLALPLQDRAAPAPQPFVVDAEESLERLCVNAAEEAVETLRRDRRRVVALAERVLARLAPEEFQRLAAFALD